MPLRHHCDNPGKRACKNVLIWAASFMSYHERDSQCEWTSRHQHIAGYHNIIVLKTHQIRLLICPVCSEFPRGSKQILPTLAQLKFNTVFSRYAFIMTWLNWFALSQCGHFTYKRPWKRFPDNFQITSSVQQNMR